MQLFDLAFRQNEWLAQRQSVISSNIANANTPGYKSKDIESFDDAMRKSLPMSATDGAHFSSAFDITENQGDGDAEVLASGNNVNVEQEFLKSSEVMRSYSLNSQLMKTFDRMLQSVTKA
jgi:flagellar basal-body rod protein FlgB